MAVAPPNARCSLSDEPIASGEDCFATSGEFLPRSDPLHKHCGKPMRWKHYADWSERPRFARAYVDAWVKANKRNPFWWTVLHDDDAYISVNPQRSIEEASVRLCAVGSDIRVPLTRWTEWLRHPESVTPLQSLELETLRPLLPKLADRFPSAHAVVDAIDPAEKRPRK